MSTYGNYEQMWANLLVMVNFNCSNRISYMVDNKASWWLRNGKERLKCTNKKFNKRVL